jgi:heat-inducible transcriptional repressor
MELTQREKIVLNALIHYFISSASPVSSYQISIDKKLRLSPATIRTILADLEKKGFIYQPHTSAGRIPMTPAYRTYVNDLMKQARLSLGQRDQINNFVRNSSGELEDIMREATHILAELSHQLGIIISPSLDEGVFQRMELIGLSSERILIVISIESGLAKTITMEIPAQISREKLELINNILNERLAGMKLGDIRKLFSDIVRDLRDEETGLINIMEKTADRVFDFKEHKELFFEGTRHISEQPEFADIENFTTMIELLENPNEVIQIINKDAHNKECDIKIGQEITEKRMHHCSIITAKYKVGKISGTIGIIGPMRMDYSKLTTLVEYTAKAITDKYQKN